MRVKPSSNFQSEKTIFRKIIQQQTNPGAQKRQVAIEGEYEKKIPLVKEKTVSTKNSSKKIINFSIT